MKIAKTSLDLIGHTPIQVLSRVSPKGGAQIWAKLEITGPGSSIKDRIGIFMLEAAEKRGQVLPGGTIIEATAGNTGVGLAVACAAKGYRFLCIMPSRFSMEKQRIIEFLGGKVLRTPTEDGMKGAIAKAHELQAEIENSMVMGQFSNQDNPDCHYQTTGPEIWEQTEGKVTHVCFGTGSGGTLTGVAKFLKEKNPGIKAYLVEPYGSTLGGGELADYWVEGIGNSFLPDNLDIEGVDGIFTIPCSKSKVMVKELALKEQILAGGSSGANVQAAFELASTLGPDDLVVTMICDRLERYISKGILEI